MTDADNIVADFFNKSKVKTISQLESQQETKKHVDKETSLETNKQGNKETNMEVSQDVGNQVNIQVSLETSKETLKRYSTYLDPKTVRKIKILALTTDVNEYDIVQRALDKYLKNKL